MFGRKKPLLLQDVLDVRGAVSEGVADALNNAGKDAAMEMLSNRVSEVLKDVGSEVVGKIFGSVIGNLLKHLLNVQDSISTKLDDLIAAPLRTGVRAAQEALDLPWEDEAQQRFREERLKFAIQELDRALTLSERIKNPDVSQFYILFLQGLCAGETTGGMRLARVKLYKVAERLEAESSAQAAIAKMAESQAGKCASMIRHEVHVPVIRPRFSMGGEAIIPYDDLLKQARSRLEAENKSLRKRIESHQETSSAPSEPKSRVGEKRVIWETSANTEVSHEQEVYGAADGEGTPNAA